MGVADGDLELVEFDDNPQTVYVCRHEKQLDREMGAEGVSPAPGSDCDLFEAGTKGKLSPELERFLARSAARTRTEE